MQIRLKTGFPWFPVVLAAGWSLMTVLALEDLAWFAAARASLGRHPTVVSASRALPPTALDPTAMLEAARG